MTDLSRVLRVFPRRTKVTPTDALALVNEYPGLFLPDADECHVSATWTWDLPRAEALYQAWSKVMPTLLGGPATGMRGEDFTPGLYMAPGNVITSRGCPNHCWFCSVPGREGNQARELPIHDGYKIHDDNLLACSEPHIRAVFDMLRRQPQEIRFVGGLEAKLLQDWHVDLLASLPRQPTIYFAYDTPDDWEPLGVAVRKLIAHGFSTDGHRIRCYVLCGWPQDNMVDADRRMRAVVSLGAFPRAMLWMDKVGKRNLEWLPFARAWANDTIIAAQIKYQGEDRQCATI